MVTDYIKAELVVLVPALIFIGKLLKDSSKVRNNLIPVILGCIGIALSILWVFATSEIDTFQKIMVAVFTSLVQGILCAGTAVYGNQIYKQANIQKAKKNNKIDIK